MLTKNSIFSLTYKLLKEQFVLLIVKYLVKSLEYNSRILLFILSSSFIIKHSLVSKELYNGILQWTGMLESSFKLQFVILYIRILPLSLCNDGITYNFLLLSSI